MGLGPVSGTPGVTLEMMPFRGEWSGESNNASTALGAAQFAAGMASLAALQNKRDIDGLKEVDAGFENTFFDHRFALNMLTVMAVNSQRATVEERQTVTLTNRETPPFNTTVDSPVSIALKTVRENTCYTVEAEVLSHTGNVGEIVVSDKARNGFKLSFTGSGSSVTLLLKIRGGIN